MNRKSFLKSILLFLAVPFAARSSAAESKPVTVIVSPGTDELRDDSPTILKAIKTIERRGGRGTVILNYGSYYFPKGLRLDKVSRGIYFQGRGLRCIATQFPKDQITYGMDSYRPFTGEIIYSGGSAIIK